MNTRLGSILLLPALALAKPTLGPPTPAERVEATAVVLQPVTPETGPVDYYASRPKVDGPRTLDELVASAMAHSPVLVAASQDIDVARQMLEAVKARLAPRLSTTSWASYGDGNMLLQSPMGVEPLATRMVPAGLSWDTNFMAMYPLTTGGRLEHRADSARAMAAASVAERDAMRLEIAFNVRALGLRLVYRDALLAVRRSEVEALEERLRVDQARFDEGKVPEYYLHRDRAELARARQMLTDEQRDRNVELADLRTVIGLHPRSELAVDAPFAMPAVPPELDADLAAAAAQRPELAAARQQIRAAWHDEKSANAAFLPQVDLVAMANLMAGRGNRWEEYLAGVAIGLPLSDGGERLAEVRAARARRGRLTATEQATLLQIGRDVTVAHEDLAAARQNLDTALLGQVAADEDYRVVTARFEAGKAINIELLDALEAKVAADARLAEARFRLQLAEEARRRAVGDASLAP